MLIFCPFLNLETFRVFSGKGAIIFPCGLATLLASPFWDDVLVEVCIVVTVPGYFVSAMFAFIDGLKISSVLV